MHGLERELRFLGLDEHAFRLDQALPEHALEGAEIPRFADAPFGHAGLGRCRIGHGSPLGVVSRNGGHGPFPARSFLPWLSAHLSLGKSPRLVGVQ